jgi:lysophospholipase L1-like esterase
VLAAGNTLGACELRLARGPRGIPTVAIVGASYTAGVGPGDPALSWAAGLASTLHWNAVIYGVPGAGYAQAGAEGLGPVTRMLAAVRLHALDPALVIVQAGHDDLSVPPNVERHEVEQTIDEIRAQAPNARIALLTVFAGPSAPARPSLYLTDHAIVAAGRAADPNVIIMDPLTGRWRFQHAHNGLHPTAAGDAWIARKVAAILRAHGVFPDPATAVAPVSCDLAISASSPAAPPAGTGAQTGSRDD